MKEIIIFLIFFFNIICAQTYKWESIAPIQERRWLHSAVELSNGETLVTGGETLDDHFNAGISNSCEIYNIESNTWRYTDTMNVKRWKHASILLDDGRVLVIGGKNELSCEIFNPITEKWTLTDSLLLKRRDEPIITKLQNGNILITGGSRRTGVGKEEIYNSCEVFDVQSEKWIKVADMNFTRKSHTATTLEDGRVLITGGIGRRDTSDTLTEICEIYNPSINKWILGDTIKVAHYNHCALLLDNGNVFISSGEIKGDSYFTEICELYDPINDKWEFWGHLTKYHPRHSTFQLSDSTILVAGGDNPHWEIFNLNQQKSTYVGISEIYWFLQSVIRLQNGKIIKIGGLIAEGMAIDATNKCEIFDPNITSINNNTEQQISSYQLFQNYPNPFNPTTIISYSLQQSGFVKLKVYDVLGREIATLLNKNQDSGNYKLEFKGNKLPSGVYYYRITVGDFVETKKMVLLQ